MMMLCLRPPCDGAPRRRSRRRCCGQREWCAHSGPRHVFGHVLGDVRALLLDAVVRERRAPTSKLACPLSPTAEMQSCASAWGGLPIRRTSVEASTPGLPGHTCCTLVDAAAAAAAAAAIWSDVPTCRTSQHLAASDTSHLGGSHPWPDMQQRTLHRCDSERERRPQQRLRDLQM